MAGYGRQDTDEGRDFDNVSGQYDNQGFSQYYDEGDRRERSPSRRPGHVRRGSSGRYIKRQDSEPPADYDDNTLRGGARGLHHSREIPGPSSDRQGYNYGRNGDAYGGHDSIEMHTVEEGRNFHHRPSQPNIELHHDGQNQLRHRRAKSQHVNGYDYYRQLQHHVNRSYRGHGDDDKLSVESLNFEDLKEARQLLATIRIRRKSRKRQDSSKKSTPREDGARADYLDAGEEEYEEEVGLPSTRQKMKGLTERLALARQLSSRSEVARLYRGVMTASESDGLQHLYTRKIRKRFQTVSYTFTDLMSRINFWSQQFKEIEGHFGIATTTYFRFTRWLVKINFMVFLLFLCFIYIPQFLYENIFTEYNVLNHTFVDKYSEKMFRCSHTYQKYVDNVTASNTGWYAFFQIATGTGLLEDTMLFYGHYSNLSLVMTSDEGSVFDSRYNMGLGYLATFGFSFVVLFIMIVHNSGRTVREAVVDFDNKALPRYTNAVFSGWDYCINSEKMAYFKQKIIFNEFKATLNEVASKRRRENRTTRQKTRLYLKRLIIHLIVVALLAGSFYTIYLTVDFLLETPIAFSRDILQLMVNYMPSVLISVLNVAVPEIFLALSKLEEYTHSFATHITIVRAVFLRLASVWVVIISLYIRLHEIDTGIPRPCPEESIFNSTSVSCCGNKRWHSETKDDPDGKGAVKCWETYVGQQFYKLGITDFISVTMVVFFIKIPRRIIHSKFKHRFWIIAKFGRSKFDLPLQVLDVVYSQTLCWTGMFFTPVLPALTFIKVFFFFFLKKFELLHVTESPANAYRASRSYSFFQTVLLVSFIAISILLGAMIGNLHPSMSCGPFRMYSKEDYVIFDVITNQVESWPDVPKRIIKYFGTGAFFLPAFLVLLLAIYYYWALASGYKRLEELLKEQIKSEAHDKQFLLARVDEIIKKGELNPADYK